MSFFIKRDITSTNHPAPDQIEVGELLLNSTTGTLYTKRVDGEIVKFISSEISQLVLPNIVFGDVSDFCCDGDSIDVVVSNLVSGQAYNYEFIDLNNNGVSFGVSSGALTPDTSETRNISVLASISGNQANSLIKFSVKQGNNVVAESVLTICCINCQTEQQNTE